eukprot:snap_masked-scaffold_11-processed-gene-8.3-mRNA-1 protein AED:1.00 eAED:1.00 QI:0/-1/0/0/-1/1/1/0/195
MEGRTIYSSLFDFDAIHELKFPTVQQIYTKPEYFWYDMPTSKLKATYDYSLYQFFLHQHSDQQVCKETSGSLDSAVENSVDLRVSESLKSSTKAPDIIDLTQEREVEKEEAVKGKIADEDMEDLQLIVEALREQPKNKKAVNYEQEDMFELLDTLLSDSNRDFPGKKTPIKRSRETEGFSAEHQQSKRFQAMVSF